jgi:hypothetical protein
MNKSAAALCGRSENFFRFFLCAVKNANRFVRCVEASLRRVPRGSGFLDFNLFSGTA